MDASDLKVFEAVARLGGMNRAAAELNTVQSNVTARIQQLEAELGVSLFRRHSRGVALTQAGRRLLPYAGRVAALMVDARRAVADDGKPAGPLSIGSLETTAALRLPPILSAYAESYPDVDLSLVMGTTVELTERVLDRAIEGAFVCGPVQHPDLREDVVFREQLAVVAPRAVRSLDEALGEPSRKVIVLRAGCSYRQRLEEMLRARGLAGMRQLEFGTVEGLLGCVAAGLGITLLPRGMVELVRHANRLRVFDLPPEVAHVDTVFIRLSEAFESSAFAAFLQTVLPASSYISAAE
jgi:DNA-binding transcriptional LysR family regulator